MVSKSEQFKEFIKSVKKGSVEPFQELNLDLDEKEKAEQQLGKLKEQEIYVRGTYRLMESALVAENIKQLERKLSEYGKGEFNFFFSKLIDGLETFGKLSMLNATRRWLHAMIFDYYAKQYTKHFREVDIAIPIDDKIPLKEETLPTYLGFIAYFLSQMIYIKRELGPEAQADLVKFVTDMAGFYAESGVVFQQAQTKLHRGGGGGVALQFLRTIDKNKNMFPSIHVEVVAHTYSRILDIIEKYDGQREKEFEFVKSHLKERGVRILESCLFLKQHGIRDISAGFAAISARDNNFTEERAGDLVNDLFKDNPDISEDLAEEARAEIMDLYRKLMEQIAADPSKDYTKILIEYVKDLEKEIDTSGMAR